MIVHSALTRTAVCCAPHVRQGVLPGTLICKSISSDLSSTVIASSYSSSMRRVKSQPCFRECAGNQRVSSSAYARCLTIRARSRVVLDGCRTSADFSVWLPQCCSQLCRNVPVVGLLTWDWQVWPVYRYLHS